MLTLYACNFHGAFAHGTVRDIRARWGLEEVGLPYTTCLVARSELNMPEYFAIHPFGKIPALRDDDGLVVFESAGIILYLGEKSEVLLPRNHALKVRVTSWICAAVSTVEGPVSNLGRIDHFPINREADQLIRPATEAVVLARLQRLSEALADKAYLEGEFTGADIMMRSVLDMLRHTDLVSRYPNLSAYMARCEARPAFQRAMRDHLAAYQTEPA